MSGREYLKKSETRKESRSLTPKHLLHYLKEFRLYSAGTKLSLTLMEMGKS